MPEEKRGRYTEAQNKATQKYIRENLEEIKFRVRKGEKDRYRVAAEKAGISMARLFLDAADEKIAREGLESSSPEPGTASETPQEATGRPAEAGGISLHPQALRTAQEAAQSVGETVPQFIERAVETQAKRDRSSLALGINPATGEKLDKEG